MTRSTAFLSESVLAFLSIRRCGRRGVETRGGQRRGGFCPLPLTDSSLPQKGEPNAIGFAVAWKFFATRGRSRGAFRSLDAARRIASFTWVSAIFAQVAESSRRRFGLIFYPKFTPIFEGSSIKNQLRSKRANRPSRSQHSANTEEIFPENSLEERFVEQFFLVFRR